MTKRTYRTILDVFDKIGRDKLSTRDFVGNCAMKRDSVYQTLSRAIRDGVINRDEHGFYFITNEQNKSSK